MAHIDAGKTTSTERILFYTGVTYKSVRWMKRTATMDWMEQERGAASPSPAPRPPLPGRASTGSIASTLSTPRTRGFTAEVERSLRVLDGAVCVLFRRRGAAAIRNGVAPGRQVPRSTHLFCEQDGPHGGGFRPRVRTIRQRLGARPVPLQFPLGREDNFIGVIDFIGQKVIVWLEETLGAKFEIFDVRKTFGQGLRRFPARCGCRAEGFCDRQGFLRRASRQMVEYIAEHDDAVLDKYLTEGALSIDEMRKSIREIDSGAQDRSCARRLGLQSGNSAFAGCHRGLLALAD